MAKARQRLRVFRLDAVQLSALQQDGFDAMHVGAVRVFCLLALGVVLAMNRGPFFGDLAGGQPQPKAEKMRRQRVEIKRAVRLVSMQKYGDTDHRDVGHCQSKQHQLPPVQPPEAMGQPIQCGVEYCPVR